MPRARIAASTISLRTTVCHFLWRGADKVIMNSRILGSWCFSWIITPTKPCNIGKVVVARRTHSPVERLYNRYAVVQSNEKEKINCQGRHLGIKKVVCSCIDTVKRSDIEGLLLIRLMQSASQQQGVIHALGAQRFCDPINTDFRGQSHSQTLLLHGSELNTLKWRHVDLLC